MSPRPRAGTITRVRGFAGLQFPHSAAPLSKDAKFFLGHSIGVREQHRLFVIGVKGVAHPARYDDDIVRLEIQAFVPWGAQQRRGVPSKPKRPSSWNISRTRQPCSAWRATSWRT